MHLSQALTVFWLVVAAAQCGTAIDPWGADHFAREAVGVAAGATAGALELKKGLLGGGTTRQGTTEILKEALLKLIKAKLTANGIVAKEEIKDNAFDRGYVRYAPVAPVAAVAPIAAVAPVRGVAYDKVDEGAAVVAKTKSLLALLASLALAKEGIRKVNEVKHTSYAAPVVAAAPVYAAAPIAGIVAPGIIGTPDSLDGMPVMSLQAPVGVAIEGGKYIRNKEQVVADKTLAITGEKILKGLLVKLGLVGAGAAADALIHKLSFTNDAELLPLFLTAVLLEERGWVPDAYVKDGVALWGQLLPNFTESAKSRIFSTIKI